MGLSNQRYVKEDSYELLCFCDFVPCDRILAKQVGFNISGKVEVMALNTTNSPVQVENEDLQKNSPEKCEL